MVHLGRFWKVLKEKSNLLNALVHLKYLREFKWLFTETKVIVKYSQFISKIVRFKNSTQNLKNRCFKSVFVIDRTLTGKNQQSSLNNLTQKAFQAPKKTLLTNKCFTAFKPFIHKIPHDSVVPKFEAWRTCSNTDRSWGVNAIPFPCVLTSRGGCATQFWPMRYVSGLG